MYVRNIFIIFYSALLMIGCTTTLKPISTDFLLVIPEQEEWTVVAQDSVRIVLSKDSIEDNVSYLIHALEIKLPNFKNDQEFLKFINKNKKENHNRSKFVVSGEDAYIINMTLGSCVQFNSKETLRNKTNNTKEISLNMVNLICRYPSNKNRGVYISYTKKSYKNNDNLSPQAEEFFSQLSFNNI